VRSIPTTYLVDPQGKVVMMWLGLNPREAYEAEIRKAIAKS
jgi:peroxiredoxin